MTKQKTKSADAATFDQWMSVIDSICWAYAGLSVYDLPDCLFADWYDRGVLAMTAAKRALRRAGYVFAY